MSEDHKPRPVLLWVQDMIERQMGFLDIDQGRAAAERRAEEWG
jgi:hypothetical protein